MPYIDRDKLIKELSTMYKQPTSTEDFMTIGYDHAIADMVVTVYGQPTADCVEVVRCRDCKFWGESLTEEERNECDVYADLVCTYWMSDGLTRDDFCSKGERREDVRKPDSDDF